MELSGGLNLDGTDLSTLPHQDAVERLTVALGQPDETTEVGQACDTHISLGYAVGWGNFRVLTQVGENPDVPNDRNERIAGWSLGGWGDDFYPTPFTFSDGITLGATLSTVRDAYPSAREGAGDGDWTIGVEEAGAFGGAVFHFDNDLADTPLRFIESGYGCGS